MLKKEIDIDKVYSSNIEFGLVSYSIKSKKALEVFKEDIPKYIQISIHIKKLIQMILYILFYMTKIYWTPKKNFQGFIQTSLYLNLTTVLQKI